MKAFISNGFKLFPKETILPTWELAVNMVGKIHYTVYAICIEHSTYYNPPCSHDKWWGGGCLELVSYTLGTLRRFLTLKIHLNTESDRRPHLI